MLEGSAGACSQALQAHAWVRHATAADMPGLLLAGRLGTVQECYGTGDAACVQQGVPMLVNPCRDCARWQVQLGGRSN